MIPVLYIIALIALIIASVTDIKKREVPDWLNYSLIFIGLGIRALYSIIEWNYWIFLYGVFGFLVFLILALVMYYAGQWGGGDSKMLMGLGALIGIPLNQINILHLQFLKSFFLQFLILILLVGAVYGIIWSSVLAIKNRRKFVDKFVELNLKHIKLKRILVIICFILFILSFFLNIFFKVYLLLLIIIALIFFYVFMFSKAVELVCMHKTVPVGKLTEGDWIVNKIEVKGQYITGPKELGITKEQIEKLKKHKIKEVLIKEGIPFVPSFLIAFIISLILDYYNIVLLGYFIV